MSDNVSDVDGSLAGLQDLGTHLTSVTVNDLAGNIGPVASALVTAFGSKLQFVLTDSMALSAGAAAGLAPVVAYLAANTNFAVGDMASSVSTNLNALEALIGHGLTAKLSARLGEGLFNGALTTRIGIAAIDVCRPLPYIESQRPRFRELVAEVAGIG